jgi:hypothetical protein
MIVFYIVLVASPVLFLVAVAFFALIVAGIRTGDRRDLASPPGNRIDSITRHVVGGVRRQGEDDS